MEDRIEKLELKITELENKLKEMGAAQPTGIDPQELKTYHKVNSQLGLQKPCAICQPQVCRPCIPLCLCPCGPGFCQACVCTCGPCVQSGRPGESFNSFLQ